jgi:hypothetical protein
MSRGWLLSVVACSTASPSDKDISAPMPAPARPTTDVTARYAYRGLTGWSDVAISGVDAAALEACEVFMRRATRQPIPGHQGIVLRACRAEPLPAMPRPRGVMLRDHRPIDDSDFLFVEPVVTGHGSSTPFTPFTAAADCERARSQLASALQKSREEMKQAREQFLAEQVAIAEAREREACAGTGPDARVSNKCAIARAQSKTTRAFRPSAEVEVELACVSE